MAELTHLITLELCVCVQAKQLQKHSLNTSINYAQLNTPQFIEENEQTDLPSLFLKGPAVPSQLLHSGVSTTDCNGDEFHPAKVNLLANVYQ